MPKRNIDEIDKPGSGGSSPDDEDSGNDDSKKQKMTISFIKKPALASLGNKPVKAINIKLGPQKSNVISTLKAPLQNVFNSDSEEEEEMPREAKMRMRNIGRETPTSAGPNSFGKTKQGFCDTKSMFEKKLKEATLATSADNELEKKLNK